MSYKVQLQNFEGPLDLLLFLINKSEVDIYDIPVAEITQQYLGYLELIEFLDLDNASDFILMAASLIRIKAKMLLPRPPGEEDDEEFDPRRELVEQLIEYQRYKEVAWNLAEFEQKQRKLYPFQNYTFQEDESVAEAEEGARDVTLYDLMSVFVEILKRVPAKSTHTVEQIPVTIEEQSDYILEMLAKRERILFTELLEQVSERIVLIVTFVAILELVKNNRLKLNQSKPFSEIWIVKFDGS